MLSSLIRSSRRVGVAVAVVAAATGALLPIGAGAKTAWPSRPIKLIVPYAPGGGTDVIARAVATKLSARLGQPIVVENKPGGGGSLGFDAVAKAPPDGYTLLFMTTAFATAASTGRPLPYDAAKDFAPVGQVGSTPLVIVVSNDSLFRTLRELIDAARSKPNTVTTGPAASAA